jgi:hypothetical protein
MLNCNGAGGAAAIGGGPDRASTGRDEADGGAEDERGSAMAG